ncbi:hypothetical protein EPVG_00164 [Emiliania huxleyi virus 201]|nr:hypothetical protein ELVG_00138 [Emiliania huxleyi virus 203]AEP15545.1 hypothetical protein EQVG_00135 [Emiliania huxleyi virus 207]AEP15967.1 hypothetical protein ERVG_00089 [Emiliania huxleyi virus 208]AET98051.1 hypothetical protein EPVG_00164 [Emiliania huxleyi virus 201]
MDSLGERVIKYIDNSSVTDAHNRVIVDLPNILSNPKNNEFLDDADEFILVTKLESIVWHYNKKREILEKALNKYTNRHYHIIIIDLPKCSAKNDLVSCTKYVDTYDKSYNTLSEKPCATANLQGNTYITDMSTVGHDTCSPDDMIQILLNMSAHGNYRGVLSRDNNILTSFQNSQFNVDLSDFDKLAVSGIMIMSGRGSEVADYPYNYVSIYNSNGDNVNTYEQPLFEAVMDMVNHYLNPPGRIVYLEPYFALPEYVQEKLENDNYNYLSRRRYTGRATGRATERNWNTLRN